MCRIRIGFYTKWLDGRIDDPNGGWKGRGLWATVSTRAPFHMEGGKGTTEQGDALPASTGSAREVTLGRCFHAAANPFAVNVTDVPSSRVRIARICG